MSSSIPSWQILTAHAQPLRGARDLAFCLTVPLDSLLVWASSEGFCETARMRRLAWTFAARTGDKYQIRLTRPNLNLMILCSRGTRWIIQTHYPWIGKMCNFCLQNVLIWIYIRPMYSNKKCTAFFQNAYTLQNTVFDFQLTSFLVMFQWFRIKPYSDILNVYIKIRKSAVYRSDSRSMICFWKIQESGSATIPFIETKNKTFLKNDPVWLFLKNKILKWMSFLEPKTLDCGRV